MPSISELHLKTGGDPRTLPDYTALRDEMSKLTHPARPDVNWMQVANLCLALFEHNGVELQTAAWYTLARTYLAGCEGMNEGLAIVNALSAHQWVQMWPPKTPLRAEILAGLNHRLQKVFRTLSLSHSDLPALYRSEKLLNALSTILSHQQIKQACQFDVLCHQIQHAQTRLENSGGTEELTASVTLPSQLLQVQPLSNNESSVNRLVYVVRTDPEVNVEVVHQLPARLKRWPTFTAGMLSAFLISGAAILGGNYLYKKDRDLLALYDSVAPLPFALQPEQIQVIQQSDRVIKEAEVWLQRASVQLDTLAALPPDWQQRYAGQLLSLAQNLWPHNPDVVKMRTQWQQTMAINTLSGESLSGWHQGMEKLQALSNKLDALDNQRGKYITVSELKTVVFSMMNNFRQNVPVEEQLRLLAQIPAGQSLPPSQVKEVEEHINRLITRLAQEKGTLEEK